MRPKPTWHPWIPSSHFAPGGLADGLVGAWFALEGAGPTAHDLSRNGNHGSLQGGVDWVAGRDGPVLSFNGSDYVVVPHSDILNFGTGAGTVVALFRRSANPGAEYIVAKRDDSKDGVHPMDYLRLESSGQVEFTTSDASINFVQVESGGVYDDGLWHLAVAAWDPPTLSLYVDGVLEGTDTDATVGDVGSSDDLFFGAAISGDGNPDLQFGGDLSLVLRFDRALPAPDIRKLHADPYALLRPVRRWWAVTLDVEEPPPAFVPQTYTADVLVNLSPTVSVDANPSPATDLESNPSPTVEVESG